MKEKFDIIIDKISDLYNVYEQYLWKHDDSYLFIIYDEQKISFVLQKGNKAIDEIILSFSDNDYELYRYLCLRYTIFLYGNVVIHNDNNIIYNDRHKPYLMLCIMDDTILSDAKELVKLQEKYHINGDLELVNDLYNQIPVTKYEIVFVKEIEERKEMAKRILKDNN